MKEQGQVDAIKDGFYRMRNFPGVIDAWIGPQLDHHLTSNSDSDNSDVDYEPMESDNETIDSYESDDVDLSEHEDDGVMLSDSWKRIAVIFVVKGLRKVERGFSQLSLVKTDRRSTLSSKHLNDNMAIKLLSSSIQSFDPKPAIDLWNSSGVCPRRPVLKDTIKVKSSKSTGETQLLEPPINLPTTSSSLIVGTNPDDPFPFVEEDLCSD
ncbi:hypothetical protein GQR58_024745 [Nymphon striatum]|nr:hypothetical protein GQR58_024745 [Nymphon striatum]